jgi:nitrite reductase/ring-hydroxylating ferredoxin subunit
MSESHEERRAERLERLVSDVLTGHHLKATPSDAADRDAIQAAAALAGTREGYPRMSPAFRRRLGRMLEKGEAPSWMNRRAALAGGLGLAAGAIGGGLVARLDGMVAASHPAAPHPNAAATPTPLPQPPTTSRSIIEPRPELARWVDTGVRLTDLAEGVPHRVSAGAIGAFLLRRGDQVVGMSSYCTHLPCELVWQSDKKVLNCPCHNLGFDIDGQSLRDGYPLPALPFVKVRLQNGHVEVLGT